MLPVDSRLRVWLYRQPTDMRKSFDGLAALARHALGQDPLSGELFCFVNRKRTYMKLLYFAGDGFCLWAKRLERGRFEVRFEPPAKQPIDLATWQLIVEGIDLASVRQRRRYHHPGRDRHMIVRPVP
ncbi:MAG: transposase [Planctomycetota bacterium]|nr:MAG: transposase [Planctomycetota bacterium]